MTGKSQQRLSGLQRVWLVWHVDVGDEAYGPRRGRVRWMAVLWTAPVLLVSTIFCWAIVDLSMGHVEDTGGLLVVPIDRDRRADIAGHRVHRP